MAVLLVAFMAGIGDGCGSSSHTPLPRSGGPPWVLSIELVSHPGKGTGGEFDALLLAEGRLFFTGYRDALLTHDYGSFSAECPSSAFHSLVGRLASDNIWDLKPRYDLGWTDVGSRTVIVKTDEGSTSVEDDSGAPPNLQDLEHSIWGAIAQSKSWKKQPKLAKDSSSRM